MSDQSLSPADPADVRDALSFALRYDQRGKASRSHQNPAADAAAQHLVEALERNGFVIMRKPPAVAHTGPAGFRQADGDH